MEFFILVAHLASGSEPYWAFKTSEECWAAAEIVQQDMKVQSDCRTAVIQTDIGPPTTSIIPRPRPLKETQP